VIIMDKFGKRMIIYRLIFLFFVIIMFPTIYDSYAGPAESASLLSSSDNTVYLPVISKPSLLNFDIATNVPAKDVEEIKTGISYMQMDVMNHFGGDIPPDVQATITVKIVATGEGNQEPGGGGSCCTGLAESGARPFFDVFHPNWAVTPPLPYTLTLHHQTTAAHEYAHGWQWYLGCLDIHSQPLGDWMNEGIAHYIGHAPFVRNGIMSADEVRDFQLSSAIFTGEADVPLESLEMSQGLWPGHVGYLAIEFLAAESLSGPMSIRTICEDVGNGISVDQAFYDVFGMTKEYFYETAWPQYFEDIKSE
jgi:hypothetical protein